jgi:hypothetical protein
MQQQAGGLQAIQELQDRSDEELEREQRNKAAAYALLGARAAERYDAKASREWYRKAIAAARPQERMALRRMADASLALAERRAGDLKVAVERLGQQAPSKRQLFLLQLTSVLLPPPGAPGWKRARGIFLLLAIVVALLLIGTGIVQLIALPLGGVGLITSIWAGLLVVILALVVLTMVGRRRQRRAKAAAQGAA